MSGHRPIDLTRIAEEQADAAESRLGSADGSRLFPRAFAASGVNVPASLDEVRIPVRNEGR